MYWPKKIPIFTNFVPWYWKGFVNILQFATLSFNRSKYIHAFFNSTQSCLTLPRHNLYLVYLCQCLGLGLLMSYLCGIFFIFSLVFTVTNHITSLKQTHLSFCTLFRISPIIFWMITWMNKVNNFQMEKVQPQGVAQLLLDFLPISVWRCL